VNKLVEQAPKIIEEAAKSPLGLLALMILALSVLAFFFFRKASPRIRVGIFVVVFLGFLLLSVALYRVIQVGQESPHPPLSGTVIKLERLPATPKGGSHLEKWLLVWIAEFHNSQIFIDKGSQQGTRQGDYFIVIESERDIKNKEGKTLGTMQEEGSLIRVVEARPNFSICQLNEFAYKSYSKALDARLAQATDKDDHIDLEKHPELLAPITVGQKVIAVPREEKAAWDEISAAYDRTLAPDITDEETKLRYADIIDKSNEFLLEHGSGYFAPKALFQKGFAQFQLRHYQESIKTFDQFLKLYPFHVSSQGAHEWIEKAREAMKEEPGAAK